MLTSALKNLIKTYPNFPRQGVMFRDLSPLFSDPKTYSSVIKSMASADFFEAANAIIAIDARGFLLGSGIALEIGKPMVLARKPGKLPGDLISKSYNLEYGENALSIQKEELTAHSKYAIVDDLLATGGTVKCVSDIIKSQGLEIIGLSVVIELTKFTGKSKFDFPVISQVSY